MSFDLEILNDTLKSKPDWVANDGILKDLKIYPNDSKCYQNSQDIQTKSVSLPGIVRYSLVINSKACRDSLASSKITKFFLERPSYIPEAQRSDLKKVRTM